MDERILDTLTRLRDIALGRSDLVAVRVLTTRIEALRRKVFLASIALLDRR